MDEYAFILPAQEYYRKLFVKKSRDGFRKRYAIAKQFEGVTCSTACYCSIS